MKLYIFFSKKTYLIKLMIILTFSVLPFKLNAFEPDNIITVDLSIADKKNFENMSCVKFVGTEIDKIYAQTTKGLRDPTSVFIDCKPHSKLDGDPLRISISCRPANGQWKCEYPALQALTIMSEQKIVVSSDPDVIYGAIDAVRYLDKIGKFTNSSFLKGSTGENICSIYEFKNSKLAVHCNESWGFDLKRLCEGDRCSFEMIGEGPVLH